MIPFSSFFLSFAVLWRFLIVFPFIVLMIVLCLIGTSFAAIFGAFLPMLRIIVIFPLVVLISGLTFATLVGIRAGLQARGHYSVPDFFKLLIASFKWGFFEAFVYVFLALGMVLCLHFVSVYGLDDYGQLLEKYDPKSLYSFFTVNRATSIVAIIFIAIYVILSTSFVVPKAAAAHSAAVKMRKDYEFFWGFGGSFISLLIVTAITAALPVVTGTSAMTGELAGYGAAYAVAWLTSDRPPHVEPDVLISQAGAMVFTVWCSCWWYAAAALAFIKQEKKYERRREKEKALPKGPPVDLRALREQRMAGEITYGRSVDDD